MRHCPLYDLSVKMQTIILAIQCQMRFMLSHLRHQPCDLLRSDIGWIGNDQIKAALYLLKQITLYKHRLLFRKPVCILSGNYKCILRYIHANAAAIIGIMQKAQQNTAGTRTHIQNPDPVMQITHDFFHQNLRILSGNQHMLIDQKIQPHKILLPRQMLQWDMHCPFLDQL